MGTLSQYSFTAADDPLACVEGPDGNIWVLLNTANKIARVTPGGTVDTFACATGTSPQDLCVMGGNIWYTCFSGHLVKISTFSGTPTQTAYDVSAGSFTPYGICAGSDGNLYVTDAGLKIRRFTSSGTLDTTFASSGTKSILSGSLRYLVEGESGYIYITNRAERQVIRLSHDAATFAATPGPDSGADFMGICYDGSNLYVAGQGSGKLYKVTTGGTQTFTGYTINASAQPTGICVGPDGRIYTAGYHASYANIYSMPAGGGSFTTEVALTGSGNWGMCENASSVFVTEYGADKLAEWRIYTVAAPLPRLGSRATRGLYAR